MLRTDDLDYDLPEELIATQPVHPRDSARLLVVSRSDPDLLEHCTVADLPRYLRKNDVVVFNRSRVWRARVRGMRDDTGGKVNGLFLEAMADGDWKLLLKSNGKLQEGMVVRLVDHHDQPSEIALTLIEKDGACWRACPEPAIENVQGALEEIGATPLPPYILSARQQRGIEIADQQDRASYQTVYAEPAQSQTGGSVAAPTAGLHFTDDLLHQLDEQGVRQLSVDLCVGWGTFEPVKSEYVQEHAMHTERCCVPAETIAALRHRHTGDQPDSRLIAIGTTCARALESVPADVIDNAESEAWVGQTQLLVTPGYQWRFVDGLLTNFHLPRSTLLAMVAALFPQGERRLLEIYRSAVRERYRFYSYGDAMLVLP